MNYNTYDNDDIFLIIKLKKQLTQELLQMKLDIISKENTLNGIVKHLKYACKHEFERDYVCSGLENIQCVKYCKHCELNYDSI